MIPNVYIVAGPNGAGKTTFASEFLPNYVECLDFVNADFIASGFSKTDRIEKAQKLGAGEYIKKPYIFSKLAKAVRNELDRND